MHGRVPAEVAFEGEEVFAEGVVGLGEGGVLGDEEGEGFVDEVAGA